MRAIPRSINSSSNPTPRSLQYWQRGRLQRSRNWRVAEDPRRKPSVRPGNHSRGEALGRDDEQGPLAERTTERHQCARKCPDKKFIPTRVSSFTGGPAPGAVLRALPKVPLLGDERTLTECNATSQFGTFKTCRLSLKMSVHRRK
jgi:hypothetical protein